MEVLGRLLFGVLMFVGLLYLRTWVIKDLAKTEKEAMSKKPYDERSNETIDMLTRELTILKVSRWILISGLLIYAFFTILFSIT